jgi:hypothetical protein
MFVLRCRILGLLPVIVVANACAFAQDAGTPAATPPRILIELPDSIRSIPHQELNARKDEPVEAVIVRSGQDPVVINLDIPSPEDVPNTPQDDPFHSAPGKR